ncbi:putative diphthamide synthesis protein-domain-containing protein [Scenedesmus sp. NREL 46B-D3]|nr:putative diphthamide synthesis protein-domain-containing protein [Scenedesmus sp. NREL 46B-D3]
MLLLLCFVCRSDAAATSAGSYRSALKFQVPGNNSNTAAGALIPHPNSAVQQPAAPSNGQQQQQQQRPAMRQQVPDSIMHNAALAAAMSVLPANYNFEIHKTVWRIQQAGASQVALQFPEGLLMYACAIADILQDFAGVEHCYVMGDVTYGACCVDDFSAAALGAQLLVHYGHSCLVPVDVTSIPCLYVFVDIQVDVDHLVATVRLNFPPLPVDTSAGTQQQQQQQQHQQQQQQQQHRPQDLLQQHDEQQQQSQQTRPQQLVLAGTIQFSSALQVARQRLSSNYPSVSIPKVRPLSPGEVLGCTAPVLAQQGLGGTDALVFVADGRFHLEAIMIANPELPAYRYDPYNRKLMLETYDQAGMREVRRRMIEAAACAKHWGVVLGTLGRQGNPRIVTTLQQHLAARGSRITTVLLSEVSPPKLAAIGHVDVWVQVACPRLSIDWGEGFVKPTLTPYEAMVALGLVPGWWEAGAAAAGSAADSAGGCSGGAAAGSVSRPGMEPYPMDYYAKDGGVWNSSYHKAQAGGSSSRGPRGPRRLAAVAAQ